MLALMHCGRAYVPLDPDFPSARIATMLNQAGADLIVGSPALLEKLNLPLPSCSAVSYTHLTHQLASPASCAALRIDIFNKTHTAAVILGRQVKQMQRTGCQAVAAAGTLILI